MSILYTIAPKKSRKNSLLFLSNLCYNYNKNLSEVSKMLNTLLVPILFALGIGIIIRSIITGAGSRHRKEKGSFIKEETSANHSKNIPIPKELFINPKLDFATEFQLENELLKELKKSMLKKADKPMILPKKEANIELKKQYGPSTIKEIAKYEENYYKYIHSLNTFAETLIRENLLDEAKETLNYTIYHMESDLKKSLELRKKLQN